MNDKSTLKDESLKFLVDEECRFDSDIYYDANMAKVTSTDV